MSVKVEKMISYQEAENMHSEGVESVGGLGGFFGFRHSMRWADYIETYTTDGRQYAEALRDYIIANKIKRGGDWHQDGDNGAPLFDDGTVGLFSYRAWGDLLAAVWSEKEDKDYNYMNFYMDSCMGDYVDV